MTRFVVSVIIEDSLYGDLCRMPRFVTDDMARAGSCIRRAYRTLRPHVRHDSDIRVEFYLWDDVYFIYVHAKGVIASASDRRLAYGTLGRFLAMHPLRRPELVGA